MKENDDNNEIKVSLLKSDDNITVSKNSVLLDDDDQEQIEEYEPTCCFIRLFCCCLSRTRTKAYFRKNWKNYLTEEGNESSDLPFNKLTRLFANADDEAIEALGDFRLNPNLVSENKLRNDLEFYIPQLCTFLLFGDIKAIEEFFAFLCKVCNASFFFAHRVHWFLSAMINAAKDKDNEILKILKMIHTVFRSPDKKKRNKIENFYIANSDDYIKYIKTNRLYFLYDNNTINEKNIFDKIDFNKLTPYQQNLFNKYKKSRDIIIDFSNKEYEEVKQKEEEKNKKARKNSKKSENEIKINEDKNTDINTDANNLIDIPNSKNYKFKSNDFLIDLCNFQLKKEGLIYEDDEELDFDNDENDTSQQNKSDLYNDKIGNDFVNINKGITDINYISYHSTLNFIEHLCDISNELPNYPIEEQMLFLYE